jgi:hypothetical protein
MSDSEGEQKKKPKYEQPMLFPINSEISATASCSRGSRYHAGGCTPGGQAGGTCSGGSYPYQTQTCMTGQGASGSAKCVTGNQASGGIACQNGTQATGAGGFSCGSGSGPH